MRATTIVYLWRSRHLLGQQRPAFGSPYNEVDRQKVMISGAIYANIKSEVGHKISWKGIKSPLEPIGASNQMFICILYGNYLFYLKCGRSFLDANVRHYYSTSTSGINNLFTMLENKLIPKAFKNIGVLLPMGETWKTKGYLTGPLENMLANCKKNKDEIFLSICNPESLKVAWTQLK